MSRAIDHLVLCVDDLERARRFYENLGFTMTPRAEHPFGTSNSLIQLHGGFLELLTVAEPEDIIPMAPGHFSFSAFNSDFLERREGMSQLVFQSDDARHDHADFLTQNLTTYEPFDFSRKAATADGSTDTLSFSLTFITDERMPEVSFFVCQQHDPQYFWKPRYQRHANGAQAIAEVIMVAGNPPDLADFFAALQGPENVTSGERRLDVTTPLGRITILSPARYLTRFPGMMLPDPPKSPYFAGYRISVSDLEETAELLRQRKIRFKEREDSLIIRPGDAFGVLIEFAAEEEAED
jgi:catechol 2,3-dioxygenase-like lactoylglutathione lyase family enzyme